MFAGGGADLALARAARRRGESPNKRARARATPTHQVGARADEAAVRAADERLALDAGRDGLRVVLAGGGEEGREEQGG